MSPSSRFSLAASGVLVLALVLLGAPWGCSSDLCGGNTVSTTDGCLTCSETSGRVAARTSASREAHAACAVDDDCTLVDFSTDCRGACPVAVAKAEQQAFADALDQISEDYCQGAFTSICGYATPGCVQGKAACTEDRCEWSEL